MPWPSLGWLSMRVSWWDRGGRRVVTTTPADRRGVEDLASLALALLLARRLHPALALALVLGGAVVRAAATVGLALALVDPLALHLGPRQGDGRGARRLLGGRGAAEQASDGAGEQGALDGSGHGHGLSP